MYKSPIVIIGAGPAGLMAAQHLAENGFEVHIYEQNKAAARKFLVAGHGGFNLTHNESITDFITRYDKSELSPIIKDFDNQDTVQWLHDLGIDTYVGSSGKIFPIKTIKPIHVLQAWLDKLNSLGVTIHYEHTFQDFVEDTVFLKHKEDIVAIKYYKLILALGGGSWQKTGSNAQWIPILKSKNIHIKPLEAANSGYNTKASFVDIEGQIVKNIEIRFNEIRKKGEVVFTTYGIEGSPLYYLNRFTRATAFPFTIYIDLKPNNSEQQVQKEIASTKNITKALKEKLKLNNATIQLLKKLPKEAYTNPNLLAQYIKNYPIEVTSFRPIDEVISTAGGILFEELNPSLNLRKYPNIYCLGEMVDWEAPTGGYLLQACFSMGQFAAKHIIKSQIITE